MLRKYEIRGAETEAIRAVIKACEWLKRFDLPQDMDIEHEGDSQYSRPRHKRTTRHYKVTVRDLDVSHFLVRMDYVETRWQAESVLVARKNANDICLTISLQNDREMKITGASNKISAA